MPDIGKVSQLAPSGFLRIRCHVEGQAELPLKNPSIADVVVVVMRNNHGVDIANVATVDGQPPFGT